MTVALNYPPPPPVIAQEQHQTKKALLSSLYDCPISPCDDVSEAAAAVLNLPPVLSLLPEKILPISLPQPAHPPLTTAARLPEIDSVSLSFYKALHYFRPITKNYASVPYMEAFNWDELQLPEDDEREWYSVAFRSKRKAGSDSARRFFFR